MTTREALDQLEGFSEEEAMSNVFFDKNWDNYIALQTLIQFAKERLK